MNGSFQLLEYLEGAWSPFADWFSGLDSVTATRVDRYLRRLEAGNFGAVKALRDGVFELRLDFGPGYRIYFGRDSRTILVLLGGGHRGSREPVEAIQTSKKRTWP